MTTAQALADLTEISSQIVTAVVFDREGTVVASTVDDERAGRLGSTGLGRPCSAGGPGGAGGGGPAPRELLRAAEARGGAGGKDLVQLDVALKDGSVFVVRDGDRVIAATTQPE